MMKPNSYMDYVGIMLMFLGVSLALFAVLNIYSMIARYPDAPINFWHTFPYVTIVVFFAGVVLRIIASIRERMRERLLLEGVTVQGKITEIKMINHIHWRGVRPYRVQFSYDYLGESYEKYSALLWHRPQYIVSDRMPVHISPQKPWWCLPAL